jgi:hypothetical protein
MGGDMVVALGKATAEGGTLFGHGSTGPGPGPFGLVRTPGRLHAPGETVRAAFVEVPQVRQTYDVLGGRPEGLWGYVHGVNGCGVAAGCARLQTRLRLDGPGLLGPDLVRLALERGRTARQATDVLTSLIARHGQGAFPGGPAGDGHDSAFLVADAREAFLVEASGRYWVCQEVRQVRAVGDLCSVRQDWDTIAPGLAGQAIARGWWPEDGSKLDFAGALAAEGSGLGPALRRWGRATLRLEEQNGRIDAEFLRRLLDDLDEESEAPRKPGADRRPAWVGASLVVPLAEAPGAVPIAWWAYGPPAARVAFPIPLVGEVPEVFRGAGSAAGRPTVAERVGRLLLAEGERPRRAQVRAALEGLQALFDGEAREFAAEAAGLSARGEAAEVPRLAGLFLQHVWEEFAEVIDGLLQPKGAEHGLALSP